MYMYVCIHVHRTSTYMYIQYWYMYIHCTCTCIRMSYSTCTCVCSTLSYWILHSVHCERSHSQDILATCESGWHPTQENVHIHMIPLWCYKHTEGEREREGRLQTLSYEMESKRALISSGSEVAWMIGWDSLSPSARSAQE